MVEPREKRTSLQQLLYYFSLLLKYRWLIIGITAFAAGGVVGYSILTIKLPPDRSPLPNTYTATAILLVQSDGGGAASSMMASLGFLGLGGGETVDRGQMALMVLGSRSILDQLVEQFGIIERAGITESVQTTSRNIVAAGFRNSYDRATGTLTIGYEHTDPVFARDIVNEAVQILDEWFTLRSGTTTLDHKQLLESKLLEVEEDIAALEERIATFQLQHGVLTVEDLGASQLEMITQLQTQLIEIEIAIKNYESYSTIEDPALKRLRIEQQNITDLIIRIENGYTGTARRSPRREELPSLALEFGHLTLNLEIQRRIYEMVSQQYEIAKLSLESDPIFQVLEMAEVPDTKTGPERGKICMIVTVLAFLASVALSLFHNAIKKTLAPQA